MRSVIGVAAALAAIVGVANAQQAMQWKEVMSLPKGARLPPGVKAAILGIEIGESYRNVKPVAEALAREDREIDYYVKNDEMSKLIRDTNVQLVLSGGGTAVTVSYVGKLDVSRNLRGGAKEAIYDTIQVYFSAPSSGQQVYAVVRNMIYHNAADQPRIPEIIASLQKALGYPGQIEKDGKYTRVLFAFDDGAPVTSGKRIAQSCVPQSASVFQESELAGINQDGKCDVVYKVDFEAGISPDHAFQISFSLSDNERAKGNLGADYKYFSDYLRSLQTGSRPGPKL